MIDSVSDKEKKWTEFRRSIDVAEKVQILNVFRFSTALLINALVTNMSSFMKQWLLSL